MSKPMAKSAIKVMTMLNLNREQAEKVDATFASYAADLAALRAENAKLREALREISRYLENPDTQFAVPMIDIVRAALA